MNRHLLTTIVALLICSAVSADYISKEQARQKAEQFFENLDRKTSRAHEHSLFSLEENSGLKVQGRGTSQQEAFYVFNADAGGYAVISASDKTPAILAYSDNGYFETEQMPPHVKAWMQDYAEQIAWLEEHPTANAKCQSVTGTAISPLLGSIKWNQGSPYYDLCPEYNGDRCYTGCVATAMAQVMRYHQWPAQTSNIIPEYTTSSRSISMPAIPVEVIDWGNMLPSYSNGYTEAQRQAVAKLMVKCGTSVEMDYGPNGSGAYMSDVDDALKYYFDYNASDIERNYYSGNWDQTIYNELAADRPVIYGGQSNSGGHAFVIDGYDANDLFHVNWGWGGVCDGYFLLSVLDPSDDTNTSTDGYSSWQEAIIGVQPKEDTGDKDGDVFTAQTVEQVTMKFKIISVSNKTCQVGVGNYDIQAVDRGTIGTVTIPSEVNGYQVTGISNYAFYYCNGITELILPNTITSLTNYSSLGYMSGLTSLSIPASVQNVNAQAIRGCNNLQEILVDQNNPYLCISDGMLMNISCNRLIYCPPYITGEYTIPATVSEVSSYAFYGTKLTKLTFPETVSSVGSYVAMSSPNLETVIWHTQAELPFEAFDYDRKLANVELCEGITVIPAWCFEQTAITEIDIPLTVNTIEYGAFSSCSNLERISFSTKVSSIGSQNSSAPFAYCNKINAITIKYNGRAMFGTTLYENAFPETVFENATLNVPTGSLDFFQNAEGWKKFQNIVEFGDPIPEPQVGEGDIWSYCAEEQPIGSYCYISGNETHIAIFIPGDETLEGAQITTIRVPTYPGYISGMERGTAWLAESLDNFVKVREVDMEDMLQGAYVDLILNEPYTITSNGVYVGFSCPERVYFYLDDETTANGSFYYKYGNQWYSENTRRIMLQVRVKNHNIPSVAAHFGSANSRMTYPNDNSSCSLTLYNDGLQAIESIDYTITVNGVSEVRHKDFHMSSGIGQTKDMTFEFTSPATPNQEYDLSVRIDKVNDLVNSEVDIVSVNNLYNVSRKTTRRGVMEEFTGTWCGWCTRGMAGMKKAGDLYGDQFIGIAIHSGDAMALPSGSYSISASSFPNSKYNHSSEWYDPYFKLDVLGRLIQSATDVDVSVTGVWNADKTQVIATSETEFLRTVSGYSVAYVLVGDSLYNSSWYQTNYYSGDYSDDPYLNEYCQAPYTITDIKFNDVMIASSYVNSRNQADAYTGSLTVGSKKTNSYTLTLPSGTALAEAIDKDYVYVIALVFNSDGTIANAAKAKVVCENNTVTPGDVNNDGTVSVTDVGCVINYILEQAPSVFVSSAADMNNDGSISITDVGMIINTILNGSSTAPLRVAPFGMSSLNKAPELKPSVKGFAVSMENMGEYIGFQMDITLPEGMNDCDVRLTPAGSDHMLMCKKLSNGNYRVICYSLTNDPFIASGSNELLSIGATGDISVSNIRFTTSRLDEVIFNNLYATPTDVASVQQGLLIDMDGDILNITSDKAATVYMYNLSGGVYRILDIQPGKNSFSGISTGVYLIDNRKLFVK